MKYRVEVSQTLEFDIEADSKEEAREKALERWNKEGIYLEPDYWVEEIYQ